MTDAVWVEPDGSTRVIVTVCPGVSPASVSVNADALSMVVPATAVMVPLRSVRLRLRSRR